MLNSNQIKFINTFSNQKSVHYILHNDVNNYDFSKGFTEVITKSTDYIRIYFDCDHISNINEYNQFIQYCDNIKNTLGEYSIGGYTNDVNIANTTGLALIEQADKIISIHIVFYQVRTKPSVLNDFIKTNKDRLDTQIDTNVYKLATSQLFRHCLSDKRISAKETHKTAGNILFGLSPSTQIITAEGNEEAIDNETLIKAFGFETEDLLDADMIVDVLDVSNVIHENELTKITDDIDNDCEQNSRMTKKLFDAIVNGFDKSITIHKDCNQSLKNEVSILPIISALNACINSEITQDDVDKALDYIYDHATLTTNAQMKWFELIHRNRNNKAQHYGGLFSILKLYNQEYYNQNILPLLKPKSSKPSDFLTERYTINDYKRDKSRFETKNDYINNLVKCLAFIDNGKYILKTKDDDKIRYSVIDSKTLNDVLNFEGKYVEEYTVTDEDVQKARKNHKKLPTIGDVVSIPKKIKMVKLLRDNDVQTLFKQFEDAKLIGNDNTVFGLFRPPNPIDYYYEIADKPELVDKFINLINDQCFDDNARLSFQHFLYTHAYLLQQHKKSNVFFVKYSTTGNTGKNYIDNAFSRLYNGFTLNGITEQQMSEKHNGGMINKLYRAYDEFDNSNYQNKSINNIVKRLTNDKIAARAMNTDTKEENDFAIDVLNTNDPGIYGMIKGGKALLSRLCIIRLQERDIRASEFADDMDVIDDKNFAYSLYNYLMRLDLTEFIKNKCYNRYPLDRTDVIVKQLTDLKSSMLDEFIDSIYDEFEQKKYKGNDVDVISAARLQYVYNLYMQDRKYKLSTSFDSELEAKGIHKINSMRYQNKVTAVYYRNHVERKDIECECFDDDAELYNILDQE